MKKYSTKANDENNKTSVNETGETEKTVHLIINL